MSAPAMPSISKVTDLAILSSGSYGNGTLPPGWVQIPVPLPADSARTGFSAITYKNVATGEVVVAFTGTNDKKDALGSDVQIAAHQPIEQHQQALDYARDAAASAGVNRNQVLYTGHSLGGALAQLAADRYGAAGITFNAPGVQWAGDPATAGSNTSVLNIRLSFDVVSLTASPTSGAIGQTLVIPATSAEGLKFIGSLLLAGGIPIIGLAALTKMGADAHFMDTVFTKLGQQYNTDIIDGWQRSARGEWTQPGIEFGQSIGASADQVAQLEHTRALLVDVNAMAVAAPERIAAAQAYGQALAQIQAQTGAQSIDMKALPNGDFAVLDGKGRSLGTLSLDDQGSALLSVGDKLYSIAADGMNADGVIGPTVSDAPEPIQQPPRTFVEALLDAFQNPQTPLAGPGPGTQYADAGSDMATDAGSGSNHDPEPNPYSYTNYLNGAGASLSSSQQSGLALQLDGLGLGGEHALSFITLPGGGVTLIQNVDGDIVGEINQGTPGANGSGGYASLSGVRINPDGSAEPITTYIAPNGQALTPAQYEQVQYSQTASAVGLMNSIIGLQHWDGMSDLQRTAAVASIYNVVDTMTGGNALPGNLGTAASVLGLLNALDQGNAGGALYSGLSLVEHLTYDAATKMGLVSDTLGGNFLPGLGFVLALDSGDPVSIASSGLSLMSSLGYIGPWGAVAAVVITLLGSMFADEEDLPMREGQAEANWDSAGNIHVSTTQDIEGGGPTATGWMTSFTEGLQGRLAGMTDSGGNPLYGLIPQRLPSMGYQYDPDGMNFRSAQGHLYLKWVDDNGQEQTRYYDGAGNRSDGTGDTLVGDFMARASQAVVPAWQAQTVLAHWQQTAAEQGVEAANAQARQIEGSGLPQELADGIHQTLQALTLTLPTVAASTDALIDMDGDGYLERTQWLAANQQILSIDANGDGQIGPGELLSLNGGVALNSLDWLDVNNDNILNARDPAFAALRLWMDVNSDGQSSGETQSLTQAGISAIDFGSNPPAVVRADGSRTALTAQTLLGDILGVSYQAVIGGVLQLDEQKNAAAIATLHAANTREFDGQAEHIHGGEVDADGADGAALTVQSGDSRLSTTSANTITTGNNRSTQTSTVLIAGDAKLQAGTTGQGVSGQAAGQAAGNAQVRSNGVVSGIAFVSSGAASAGDEIRQATEAMVRSATQGVFDASSVALTVVAAGAAAVQWPTLASAATSSAALTSDATSASLVDSGPVSPVINWQALEGSRVSVTAQDGSTPATPSGAASTSMTFTGSATPAGTTVPTVYESNQAPALVLQAPEATNSIANSVSAESAPASLPISPASSANVASSLPVVSGSTLIDYPKVQGEQGVATEDTVRRFAEALLLANDSTVNAPARPGEPGLRITSVFAPVHGSVSLQADASGATEVVFVPEANYHGPASFSYTVSDQYGLSSITSVSLQVAPVNDAPMTTGETAAGDEDHTLQFTAASLLANDLDVDSAVDGDVLRITRVGAAQHGQVFLAADGTVSFIPDVNYNGPAQFTYWVGDRGPEQIAANGAGEGYETPATANLTVLAVNDLPVVTGEVMDSDEDLVLDINPALLLANDTDVDTSPTNDGNAEPAQVLAITAVSNAQHGSITLLADGTLRFTPEQNYFGAAGFSYTVDDGVGGQVVGQVVVNLALVNDAPDVVGETVSFNEDDIQTLTQASLLANDSDVDNPHGDLRIVSVENATHGTVGLNPDGSIRFVPAVDYFGPAQFTYTVSDGVGGFTVGTASLDIAPVNDAPRLLGETVALDEDTEARFAITSLLANDHDVDNLHAELVITAAGSATNGNVQIIAGEIVFTPTLNFNGQASFTYTVSDGVGGSSEATVNLNFTPVNDAPVANSELIWGKRDVSYTLSQAALLANDTDVESPNNLQISAIGNVQHGTAALNANGSVSFTPEAGYAGRGSFDYLVRDPDGATSTATAQIDFSRININPTATDDSFIGYEDVVFSITQAQLLGNDLDADNPNTDLRVTAVAGAQNGTVSLDANGTVRFTPTANFHGIASFTYQVSDGEGGNTWAMAQLNVQSVNDAPVVEAIWYGTPIYGYKSGPFGEVDPSLVAVVDEAEARSLLAVNQLLAADTSAPLSVSYYQNGMLRPYQINLNDGYMSAHSEGNAYEYDDTMRQNGRVIAYDPDGDSSAITLSIGSSPQHGHAWANVFMPSSDLFSSTHETAPAYFVMEAGAWQYYSHASDFYTGADSFTVMVTDGQGASTTATIATTHRSTSSGGMYPIVVDLNGNGIELIRPEDSNVFADVNGDGVSERIGWASNEDGVLAFDANQDGRITEDAEVSFAGYKDGALTDLEGLTAFDTNEDGQLTAADSAWSQFGVLHDANGNGQQDDGELVSLDQLGITAIGLERQGAPRLDHGNVVFGLC